MVINWEIPGPLSLQPLCSSVGKRGGCFAPSFLLYCTIRLVCGNIFL